MHNPQTRTSAARLVDLVSTYKRLEEKKRDEIARAKLVMTRKAYDRRSDVKKVRDLRRLEKLTQSLAELTDLRQKAEALLQSREQAAQGIGMIEAALAHKAGNAMEVEEAHGTDTVSE